MIRTQPFGNTGHLSTATLFGAAAFFDVTQEEADRTLDLIQTYGVNHIDTAASYGDSELRLGPWIKHHRKEVFLATKTGERSYTKARNEIHRSLERLQTDRVDLLQLHCLIDPEEWEEAMGPGGALEAAIEARDQGLTRFIGVTGHDWNVAAMHMKSIERFDFDSVLLPLNIHMMANAAYRADFNKLYNTCRKRKIAFQTIKSIARGPWADQPKSRATWYQPLEAQEDIDMAVHYVLGHEGVFLNTAGDINLLPRILDAASRDEALPSGNKLNEFATAAELEDIFGS